VIAGSEGGSVAAAVARTPVNARCKRAMWVSGKLLRGLGMVLGGSAGSSEARTSELHGDDAMADVGKGERACGCSRVSFYRRHSLEEGPSSH
jgi:hypothetical protein